MSHRIATLAALSLLLAACGTTHRSETWLDGSVAEFVTHSDLWTPNVTLSRFQVDHDGDGVLDGPVTHVATGSSSASQVAFPLAYLGGNLAVGYGLSEAGTTNVQTTGGSSAKAAGGGALASSTATAAAVTNPPPMPMPMPMPGPD